MNNRIAIVSLLAAITGGALLIIGVFADMPVLRQSAASVTPGMVQAEEVASSEDLPRTRRQADSARLSMPYFSFAQLLRSGG